jgi:hypothetical protein
MEVAVGTGTVVTTAVSRIARIGGWVAGISVGGTGVQEERRNNPKIMVGIRFMDNRVLCS